MSKYLFVYRAPRDYTPSPDAALAWQGWFQSLGPAVVDVGNPVFSRTTIGVGPAGTDLSGYSVVEADDLNAAVVLAEGCPVMNAGGGVEVGAITLLSDLTLTTTAQDHARANALAV